MKILLLRPLHSRGLKVIYFCPRHWYNTNSKFILWTVAIRFHDVMGYVSWGGQDII